MISIGGSIHSCRNSISVFAPKCGSELSFIGPPVRLTVANVTILLLFGSSIKTYK
jgi:hypothetical protein